jgi:hypothetical protein
MSGLLSQSPLKNMKVVKKGKPHRGAMKLSRKIVCEKYQVVTGNLIADVIRVWVTLLPLST